MNEHYASKLKQAQKTKRALPYLTIMFGPTIDLCPVHAKNKGLVLPVDHPYWTDYPMRETDECKCSIRQISEYEYAKIKVNGILDPLAPPILDENGKRTGHRQKVLIPIAEEPVK
ncbi:regulator of ribonuclease activity A [Vibrio parahaemolyticus]|uniref:regulator of ribonuclease activity A n=1 Tax=Vibrio parahaemolyticus TaxID=670 RepID=UPI000C868C97|nr:regulator of ribonuclease activity A [Vibrio parahaemolyticus]MBE3761247.1 regulator of ribonuclease activity A [Vibrio parahaemolyticus]MDF4358358.1 regulator of ribonuclease activity A [Vibrio parahaemolyticus]MDG2795626.1 regulator of ribonuclease activity A [Vibrio parahaemolyticus]MDK9426934.1 regulator of ribonuclease activity A [Vibrio parahaemolyticus]MDK9434268.1 regulator of ribonuclease activity A [Vibrio parahaemolyticus]